MSGATPNNVLLVSGEELRPMTSRWSESGGIKIKRANQHISDLHAAIETMAAGNRDGLAKDRTPQGDTVVFVHFDRTTDPLWGAVVGEVLHNLRSGLNMLWRHVCENAGNPVRGEADFPIYATPEAFDAMSRRKPKTRMQGVMEVYCALKPYKGGNAALWLLHDLNNIDKHQLVTLTNRAVTHGVVRVQLGPDIPTTLEVFRPNAKLMGGTPIAAEEGTPLYFIRSGFEDKVNVHTQITTFVAFGQPEVVKGEAVIPTLRNLAGVVDGAIEAFRLGGFVA
ncbi:MAG: hypothetical protein U9Q74_06575 [Gemmatimonadota bacterium]|nr:hypothetical protein [Gemmatimonadota bacterium]